MTQAIAERTRSTWTRPGRTCPRRCARRFLYGTERRPHLRLLPEPLRAQALVHDHASRASSPTSSAATARPTPTTPREDRGVHVGAAVPGVRRRAAAARSRWRCRSAGSASTRSRGCRRARAIEWFEELELTDTERQIARLILREIDERLRFLDNVGRRLPVAGPRGGHALGRRGAADPAGHPDRLEPRGRALHPRRAVDRPAPARQRAADRARSSGCATSATR